MAEALHPLRLPWKAWLQLQIHGREFSSVPKRPKQATASEGWRVGRMDRELPTSCCNWNFLKQNWAARCCRLAIHRHNSTHIFEYICLTLLYNVLQPFPGTNQLCNCCLPPYAEFQWGWVLPRGSVGEFNTMVTLWANLKMKRQSGALGSLQQKPITTYDENQINFFDCKACAKRFWK